LQTAVGTAERLLQGTLRVDPSDEGEKVGTLQLEDRGP
jgi:hypothetical protein